MTIPGFADFGRNMKSEPWETAGLVHVLQLVIKKHLLRWREVRGFAWQCLKPREPLSGETAAEIGTRVICEATCPQGLARTGLMLLLPLCTGRSHLKLRKPIEP